MPTTPCPSIDEGDIPDEALVSLGSLFYEPVWLFYRSDSAQRLLQAPELTNLKQLAGWRFNIGAPRQRRAVLMNRAARGQRIDPATLTLLRERRRRP